MGCSGVSGSKGIVFDCRKVVIDLGLDYRCCVPLTDWLDRKFAGTTDKPQANAVVDLRVSFDLEWQEEPEFLRYFTAAGISSEI
jgi:hypothetical protein